MGPGQLGGRPAGSRGAHVGLETRLRRAGRGARRADRASEEKLHQTVSRSACRLSRWLSISWLRTNRQAGARARADRRSRPDKLELRAQDKLALFFLADRIRPLYRFDRNDLHYSTTRARGLRQAAGGGPQPAARPVSGNVMQGIPRPDRSSTRRPGQRALAWASSRLASERETAKQRESCRSCERAPGLARRKFNF